MKAQFALPEDNFKNRVIHLAKSIKRKLVSKSSNNNLRWYRKLKKQVLEKNANVTINLGKLQNDYMVYDSYSELDRIFKSGLENKDLKIFSRVEIKGEEKALELKGVVPVVSIGQIQNEGKIRKYIHIKGKIYKNRERVSTGLAQSAFNEFEHQNIRANCYTDINLVSDTKLRKTGTLFKPPNQDGEFQTCSKKLRPVLKTTCLKHSLKATQTSFTYLVKHSLTNILSSEKKTKSTQCENSKLCQSYFKNPKMGLEFEEKKNSISKKQEIKCSRSTLPRNSNYYDDLAVVKTPSKTLKCSIDKLPNHNDSLARRVSRSKIHEKEFITKDMIINSKNKCEDDQNVLNSCPRRRIEAYKSEKIRSDSFVEDVLKNNNVPVVKPSACFAKLNEKENQVKHRKDKNDVMSITITRSKTRFIKSDGVKYIEKAGKETINISPEGVSQTGQKMPGTLVEIPQKRLNNIFTSEACFPIDK